MRPPVTPKSPAAGQARALPLAVEADQAMAQTARELGVPAHTRPTWSGTSHRAERPALPDRTPGAPSRLPTAASVAGGGSWRARAVVTPRGSPAPPGRPRKARRRSQPPAPALVRPGVAPTARAAARRGGPRTAGG
jgi:hypothetical protein